MRVSSTARPRTRRVWFMRLALSFALLLGSASAALLVMEGLVRLVAPQQIIDLRPELWQAADSVGHLRRPNVVTRMNTGERVVTVRTDKDGFRVGSVGRREAPTKVLLIGDSFMEALQVEHEQSTAHLLESELAARLGRPVVVRNAGVSDWDPNQYLIRARSLLAKEDYALLVVSVFVGNDAVNRVPYVPPRAPFERKRFHFPRALTVAEFMDGVIAPFNDALETRSHLYVLLKARFSVLRMRLGLTADYFPIDYLRAQANSPRWVSTAAILSELSDVAEAKGVPTIFVLVPEAFQVYSNDFDDYVRGFGIDTSAVDLEQPSRRLEEELTSAGLAVIQTLDDFRAVADSSARLFGLIDHHLTPEGHQVLARLVSPYVVREISRD